MSTRQRRSGADGGGLNKAMLHLLDVSRLRKELEQRGLDNKGSKMILASRLEEAVWPEDFTSAPAPPPSIPDVATPTTQKRGLKRKAEQAFEEAEEEDAEPDPTAVQPAKRVTRRSVKLESEESVADVAFVPSPVKEVYKPVMVITSSATPFQFVWASEAPVKALQKADPALFLPSQTQPPAPVKPKQKLDSNESTPKPPASTKEPSPKPPKVKETTPKTKEITPKDAETLQKSKETACNTAESAPKSKELVSKLKESTPKAKEKPAEVAKAPKIKPTEQKSSKTGSLPTPKPAAPAISPPVDPIIETKAKTDTPKASIPSPQPALAPSTNKKDEKKKVEKVQREAPIEILETVQKVPKEAKPKVKTAPSSLSSKTPMLEPKPGKEGKTQMAEPKHSKESSKKVQSPVAPTVKTAVSKPLSVDVTSPLATPKPEQPSSSKSCSSVQPSSTPSPSPGPRPIGSKKTIHPHNSSSTDSNEPSTPGPVLKKKSILPPPKKVTGGIDLLDNIIARQDVLLADKYKSEQEKALEKQRFELEKRKLSGAQSFGPLELARKVKKTVSDSSDPLTSPPFEPLSPPMENVIDAEEMEEGISLPRPSVRDPLGLNIMEPIAPVVAQAVVTQAVVAQALVPQAAVAQAVVATHSPSNPPFQRRFDSQPTPFFRPSFISPNSLLKAPPPPPPPPPPRLPPPPPPSSSRPPTLPVQFHLQPAKPALISKIPPPPPPKTITIIAPSLPKEQQQAQPLPPRRRRLDVMKPLSPRPTQIASSTVYNEPAPVGLLSSTVVQEFFHPPTTSTNLEEGEIRDEGEIQEQEEQEEDDEQEQEFLPPPPVYHHPRPKFLENSFIQISTIDVVENDAKNEAEISEKNAMVEEDEEVEVEVGIEESTMSDSRSVLSEMVSSIVEQGEQEDSLAQVTVEEKPLKRTVTFDTDEEEEVEGEEVLSSDGDSDGWSAEEDDEEEGTEAEKEEVNIEVRPKEEPREDNRVSEDAIMFDGQQQQEVQTTAGLNTSSEMDTCCEKPESDQQEVKPLRSFASSPQKNSDGISQLLRDPKALLKRASDVLKKINESEVEKQELQIEYEQIDLDPEYTIEEEEKPLPDFHGEPVPEDDDDDDALFEIAAGISRPKKKDIVPLVIEEPLPDDDFIELDYYNADMNIKASSSNKWLIEPDNGDGFALMWGGVRSNYGIAMTEDMSPIKIAFQIKIVEFLSLKHVPFEELEPHDVRIGWSIASSSNMLGESAHSYAFGSLGKKAQSNVFSAYGDAFHVDDIITTVLDLEHHEIRYYKNGISLGVAFDDVHFNNGDAVFPHVSTKNCKVLVNFRSGGEELPEAENKALWSLPLEENDAVMVGSLDYRKGMVASRRPPPDKTHCTVIMMVGLPGAGKSTWVRQYLRDHPSEHWLLLNTDTILNAMTVNGIPRRRVHQGRWDMVMGLTAKALNRSLQMACRRRHNYIVDQTNVSREARRRKLTQFVDFQRKCVVLIPSDEDLDKRLIKQSRQEGGAGQIPAEAMLELKAMFSIPCTESEPIEDVLFVEPPISRVNEAIELIKKYNEEAKPWIRKPYGRTQKPESTISDNRDIPNQWLSGRPSM